MVWPAIIAAAATIGSALLGKKGAEDTNEANERMSREQMEFNAEQADINRNWSANEASINRAFQSTETDEARAWSEHMANTQYQRAMGDLRRSGLNPMLAYSQGGAPTPATSTPSGSMPSGGAASYTSLPARQNTMQAGMNAAFQAAQLTNLTKTGQNIDADTKLKTEQAAREAATATNVAEQTKKIEQEVLKTREEIQLVMKQHWNETTRGNLMEAQRLLTDAQKAVANGQLEPQAARAAVDRVDAILKQLQIPEAQAYAEKFKGDFGREMSPYIREIVDILRTLIYGGKTHR